MKKAILLFCMILIIPSAMRAQSKEIFKGILSTYSTFDDEMNIKSETVEVYRGTGTCSYYYADKITPRYFSLLFKMTDEGGGRAAGVDSQNSTMEKMAISKEKGFCYRFINTFGDGSKQAILITTETNKVFFPEVSVGDLEGNKYKYKFKLTFWTDFEPVKKVLDWIWENRIIPRL